MGEALIIKTGEILDIKCRNVAISPELAKNIKSEKSTTETWIKTNSDGGMSPVSSIEEIKNEKLPYYVLSDGNKYSEKELIVGLDNIREYRIKNIIE